MLKGKTIYHMSKARPLLLSPKYQTEIEKVYTTKSCNMNIHPIYNNKLLTKERQRSIDDFTILVVFLTLS